MKTINLNLFDKQSIFTTLKNDLGGELTSLYRETEFKIDRKFGNGTIRGIELENGVTFLEFDLTCNDDLKIVVDNSAKTNVNFVYCCEGSISHAFESSNKEYAIEPYQTSIISNIKSSSNILHLKKDINVKSTLISVNTAGNTSGISNKIEDFIF